MYSVPQTHFLVYKITNTINGKTYIGCHKTKNPDDSYMGSGKYLKRARAKYGPENFKKEILLCLTSSEEMFSKEKELIAANKPEYNLHEGGLGGFEYINKSGLNNSGKIPNTLLGGAAIKKRVATDKELREEFKKRGSELFRRLHREGVIMGGSKAGWKHKQATKDKISRANRGKPAHNKGIPMLESVKKKISKKLRYPRRHCPVCDNELKLVNKSGFCQKHINKNTYAERAEICNLHSEGLTLREIGKIYNISHETVRRIIRYNDV